MAATRWRAYPLVSAVSNGSKVELKVSNEAQDALRSIDVKSIAVYGLFGPKNSGKRLLLETMLQLDEDAFHTDARDVILWMWLRTDENSASDDPARILLVAGEAEKEEEEEKQKLALLLLLSSVLLYNVEGEIGAEVLEWTEKVAHSVRLQTQDEHVDSIVRDFKPHAPVFVWLVRNCKLKWLKDRDGQKLTPTQYLEQQLKPEPGYGDAVTRRNRWRLLLELYFPMREGVALSRTTQMGDGRTPFRDDVAAFYDKFFCHQEYVKTVMGVILRPAQFVVLLESYVKAMNDGQLPTLQSAHSTVLTQQMADAFQDATQRYSAVIQSVTDNKAQRFNPRALQLASLRGMETAMAHLYVLRGTLPPKFQATVFQDQLKAWKSQIKAHFESLLDQNTVLSTTECIQLLEKVVPSIDTLVNEKPRDEFGEGIVPYLTQYKAHLHTAIDTSTGQAHGPALDACLETFLLDSVRSALEKWCLAVLGQYQVHVQSWEEEKQQLKSTYERLQEQQAEVHALIIAQERLQEQTVAEKTNEWTQTRRALQSDLLNKSNHLHRLTLDLSTLQVKQEMRVKNAESELTWVRDRTEKLAQMERTEQQERVPSTTDLLANQRQYHDKERALLEQQKDVMAHIVSLEREMVQKRTKHVQTLVTLEKAHATKVNALKLKLTRQVQAQTKKERTVLVKTHDDEMQRLEEESTVLDTTLATIRHKLASYEKKQALAAARRAFFRSLPMMPFPLMPAPVPHVGVSIRRPKSEKNLDATVRSSSLSTTSTSPIAE